MPRKTTVEPPPAASVAAEPKPESIPLDIPIRVIDGAILCAFLALVFVLGVFPLNDTDFWWHLRTGDLIRQSGQVPHVDPYLFGGPPEKRWIDLHWLFQVLLSAGYERGGVPLLNLAKCAITTLSVGLLITSRRSAWPLWVMVLAWLPALFLLAGRMYVRPETISLLYMSVILCVLFRWKRRPVLAWVLPPVMLLWVNTQGIFILGLGLIAVALVDAAMQRPDRVDARRWWLTVLPASACAGLVCLANPYFLEGAMFPLSLASTMGSDAFKTIAELQSIQDFVKSAGWWNVPIWIYITTIAVGTFSFVVPAAWSIAQFVATRARAAASKRRKRRTPEADARWVLSSFRLVTFVAFAVFSLRATRNSHQFAAIAGTITAWNLGEWAAAIRSRRDGSAQPTPNDVLSPRFMIPRVATLVVVLTLGTLVASGAYYEFQGEDRTVGLGERPLWFPHDAVKSASLPGMPEQFVGFHLGDAAVWEYHQGPERKIYCDARLEVIGPALYLDYLKLSRAIVDDRDWRTWFAEHGNPGILVDLIQADNIALAATLFASRDWRCVWFDPIAAVFVHQSYTDAPKRWNFAQQHFGDSHPSLASPEAKLAAARAVRDLVANLSAQGTDSRGETIAYSNDELTAPMILFARGLTQQVLRSDPDNIDAWKLAGQLESQRIPRSALSNRRVGREPFDPVTDLAFVRAIHALQKASPNGHGDFTTLVSLAGLFQSRGMLEASRDCLETLLSFNASNPAQRKMQDAASIEIARMNDTLGAPLGESSWRNRDELERAIDELLRRGRMQEAAHLMQNAYAPRSRTWEQTDRLATIWLMLGMPDQARDVWQAARNEPRPALRNSRRALADLAAGKLDSAYDLYNEALDEEPDLFEARYALAVILADLGRRDDARKAGMQALEHAPGSEARITLERFLRSLE